MESFMETKQEPDQTYHSSPTKQVTEQNKHFPKMFTIMIFFYSPYTVKPHGPIKELLDYFVHNIKISRCARRMSNSWICQMKLSQVKVQEKQSAAMLEALLMLTNRNILV